MNILYQSATYGREHFRLVSLRLAESAIIRPRCLAQLAMPWPGSPSPGRRTCCRRGRARPRPDGVAPATRLARGLRRRSAPTPISICCSSTHRTVTHSVGAVAVVGALAAGARPPVTGTGHDRARRRRCARPRTPRTCCSTGWRRSRRRRSGFRCSGRSAIAWFISGCDLFRQTERRHLFDARRRSCSNLSRPSAAGGRDPRRRSPPRCG